MNTKERILKEALALFSQKGFKAVTVDDIARRVGIKVVRQFSTFALNSRITAEVLQSSNLEIKLMMKAICL